MPTPLDIARIVTRKAEEARIQEAEEISANNHLAFDDDCEHHCTDCCPGLYMLDQI